MKKKTNIPYVYIQYIYIYLHLTPLPSPKKQHGSDLTQLWQHTSTVCVAIHPHLNWVDSEIAVNRDW